MKSILVTGGAGFIGSCFIKHLLAAYPEYHVVNLDALTYAGNLANLADISPESPYTFIKADIRDGRTLTKIFAKYQIRAVVNFAAESHVDRSIVEPGVFLTTNTLGTQILLDVAKESWNICPGDKYCRDYHPGVKFLQVSTDEVYGSLGKTGLFTEAMPLEPNNPYSASKASADLITRSYYKTYDLPVNIARSGNNFGPRQFPEKLIPLIINNSLKEQKLPIYGDGRQIRDWLYVEDTCRALDAILHNGRAGEIYNVGGNNERTNMEITRFILHALGKSESLIKYVKDRPGHDRRYALDCSKIKADLGWEPIYKFDEALTATIEWYLANDTWIKSIITGEYQSYYAAMYQEIIEE